MMFIRIHPFNPKRGFKIKRFNYRGQKFESERGWYQVEDDFAEEVRDLKQNPYEEDSKPVFEVADEDGAKALSLVDHENVNPEVKIAQAVAGAQTVKPEKLDPEPPAATKRKAKKEKKGKDFKGKDFKGKSDEELTFG